MTKVEEKRVRCLLVLLRQGSNSNKENDTKKSVAGRLMLINNITRATDCLHMALTYCLRRVACYHRHARQDRFELS